MNQDSNILKQLASCKKELYQCKLRIQNEQNENLMREIKILKYELKMQMILLKNNTMI